MSFLWGRGHSNSHDQSLANKGKDRMEQKNAGTKCARLWTMPRTARSRCEDATEQQHATLRTEIHKGAEAWVTFLGAVKALSPSSVPKKFQREPSPAATTPHPNKKQSDFDIPEAEDVEKRPASPPLQRSPLTETVEALEP